MTKKLLNDLIQVCQESALLMTKVGGLTVWVPLICAQLRTLIDLTNELVALSLSVTSACATCRARLDPKLLVISDFVRGLDDEEMEMAECRLFREAIGRKVEGGPSSFVQQEDSVSGR